MELFYHAQTEQGLSAEEIRAALIRSLEGKQPRKALLLPPDYTRYHSNAGFITNVYYHLLRDMGCEVDLIPALGTHVPVTERQWVRMFGDVPYEKMLVHNWRTDVMKLGEVPASFLEEVCGIKDEGMYAFEELARAKTTELGMLNAELESQAKAKIAELRTQGDTAGGVVEIRVKGLKCGFGSMMTYAEKLDAQLAQGLMSIQAIKGIEIGEGFGVASKSGKDVHDEIFYSLADS